MLRGYQAPGSVWREQDGLLAAALVMYEADLCKGCGQPLSESTDPLSSAHHPDGTHRYEVPDPSRCFSCDALEAKAEKYKESDNPSALKFGTRRVPRVAGRR